ncbi:MAG: GvpL/GvpF family gas vesicle protein [Bacteroidota bacterium]
MENDLIYVYCIADSPPDLVNDMNSKGLKSLMFNNFYIVVKVVSEHDFSEDNFKQNLSDIQWVEKHAREHVRVIRMIMEYTTVIPFKFGTIYNDKAGLQKFITDYSESLIENFNHIRGKEEWSIKIYCDRKSLCEQIDHLSKKASELEKQIMASSPGKAFLLGLKKTDLIENEMDRLCKEYGQKYFDEFNSLSESSSLSNLLPKEYTGKEEVMILNAAFLVSKDKVPDFKWTFDTLKKNDGDFGFIIEVTGPWPPFSFISIKEKL